jgi:hypothetical protein
MKTQDMVRELLEVTERFNKTASPQIDRDRISHATNIIHLASKIFADSSQQWLNREHPNSATSTIVRSNDGDIKSE